MKGTLFALPAHNDVQKLRMSLETLARYLPESEMDVPTERVCYVSSFHPGDATEQIRIDAFRDIFRFYAFNLSVQHIPLEDFSQGDWRRHLLDQRMIIWGDCPKGSLLSHAKEWYGRTFYHDQLASRAFLAGIGNGAEVFFSPVFRFTQPVIRIP